MAKATAKARRIFSTGLVPSLTDGGEVTGGPDGVLKRWRALATARHGRPRISKDAFGALWPDKDPIGKVVQQPSA
eukprot:5424027-Alexandrium_andersonii.AAC.1